MSIRKPARTAALTAGLSLLVVALVGPLTTANVLAAANPPKPKAAKPIGPAAFHPLDAYGSTVSDNVVLKWNDQALAAIRTVFPAPPVSARALAIMNTSM